MLSGEMMIQVMNRRCECFQVGEGGVHLSCEGLSPIFVLFCIAIFSMNVTTTLSRRQRSHSL